VSKKDSHDAFNQDWVVRVVIILQYYRVIKSGFVTEAFDDIFTSRTTKKSGLLNVYPVIEKLIRLERKV
jgi:hypothetical protein